MLQGASRQYTITRCRQWLLCGVFLAPPRWCARGAAGRPRRPRSASARRAGRLYIGGTGEYNKLGVGDQNDREAPVVVEDLRDVPVTHVACGKYHTAAVAASGEVYMWGHESSGQLGLGSAKTKAPTPRKVRVQTASS